MFNFGLADGEQVDIINNYTESIVSQIKAENYEKAFRIWDEMLNGDLTPYPNYFHNITDSNDYDNFLRINAPVAYGRYVKYLDLPEVRAALQVRYIQSS